MLFFNHSGTSFSIALLLAATGIASARTQSTGSGFQAANAADSCGCDSINGTCADSPSNCAGAMINCNSGFFDCDGNLGTGCECGPTSGCDTASCTAGTCVHTPNVGQACAADCQLNPTCNASGTCAGTMAPDNTVCAVSNCMDPTGSCVSGLCKCAHPNPPDMAQPIDLATCTGPHCGNGGTGKGGCSMSAYGAAPASAWTLFALLGVALLLRRRSA